MASCRKQTKAIAMRFSNDHSEESILRKNIFWIACTKLLMNLSSFSKKNKDGNADEAHVPRFGARIEAKRQECRLQFFWLPLYPEKHLLTHPSMLKQVTH
jgi:hypothetical protein